MYRSIVLSSVSLTPKTPFPFPFKRLLRRLTTTLCYNKGLGPDEKRRTADSFVVSYFFFSGLRPHLSRLVASPLACLGFACSNFAKKNKRLLVV